jgi:hypothetical protein
MGRDIKLVFKGKQSLFVRNNHISPKHRDFQMLGLVVRLARVVFCWVTTTIRMIKSRMKLPGHVARWGLRAARIGYW